MKQGGSSKFQAVSSRRLTEEVADQIERLILSDELLVGDGLPSERTLAKQMGISRNILREAISMLTQKGLLEVRPGTGTFVVRPGSEFLSDILLHFIHYRGNRIFLGSWFFRTAEEIIRDRFATCRRAFCLSIRTLLDSLVYDGHIPIQVLRGCLKDLIQFTFFLFFCGPLFCPQFLP